MSSTSSSNKSQLPDNCWNTIGVFGDKSCDKLQAHLHCRNCTVYQNAGWKLLDHASPTGYLEEWADRLTQPQDADLNQGIPVILFRISDEWLAIAVHPVSEVTTPRAIHTVPHRSNQILLGLTNVRGELPLCIAMHRLLQTGDEQNERSLQQITGLINEEGTLDPSRLGRLLVVRLSNGLWALWVDEVVGVMRLDQQHINSVPSTLKRKTQSLLQGVYQMDNRSVGLIDEDKLAQQLVKVLP